MKIAASVCILALFISLTMMTGSCTQGACFEETIAYVKGSFYDNSTKKMQAPDSITLIGHEQEKKIYDRTSGVQPALFPLNAAKDKSKFVIKINGITDTIEFSYSSYPHLISKECGYTFYFTIDLKYFTQNNIDTILVINKNVSTINEENIRIFY